MTDPYRERPPMLECPRCGEVLADVTAGVSMCSRCGGIWLAQRAVNAAFRDPTWPHGISMWWRRELTCPQCAFDGNPDAMSAVAVGDLMLDRCFDHGLWLDRGELARLVGTSPVRELEWLTQLLRSDRRPPPKPVREADEAAERQRAELDAYRADVAERETRDAEREAKAAKDEADRRHRVRILELEDVRDHASTEIEELTRTLREDREQIASNEAKLADAQKRLREAEQELARLR